MCSFRVPDGMSQPSRSGSQWHSSVSIPVDEDGFFGRECPNRDCLAYFKLHVEEYDLARQQGRLTCPVCGATEADDHFLTQEQVQRVQAAGMEMAKGAMNRILNDFAQRGTRRTGAVTFKWNRPAPHVPKPLPTYVEKQTIRTFTCPNGGHQAVVYDLLAFCPYCGPDTPPRAVFDDTMAAMRRLLTLVEQQPVEAQAEVRALGGVTVFAERALTNVVAGVQNLAKQTHAQAGHPPAKGNPWQNVDRLQKQWIADMKSDPLAGLSDAEIKTLRLAFGRRHILEHNGGVADAKYLAETGEGVVGRKVRISPSFVEEAFVAATHLADHLAES